MIPRLHISFPLKNQITFWFGQMYSPQKGEYMLNHARTGIVIALRAAMPQGGRVGVVAYNCHTVANAVVEGGCTPVFIDVTEDLHISLQHLAHVRLDAIIVTNLFGMHNDIAAIQAVQPNAIIIVDNAHGYGLPIEGDFTVYSINQGKMPALGAGGLLYVNNVRYQETVEQQYAQLSKYSLIAEIKLFIIMLLNAWMHIPMIYGMVTFPLKRKRKGGSCREKIAMKRMAKGVSRLYNMALPQTQTQIIQRTANAQYMLDVWQKYGLGSQVWYGENAFMLIGRHENPEKVVEIFAAHGVEVATHFARAIEWAKEFGYVEGSCPMAERLTKELIMIPTYKEIKL
jgi:dTDP-4-amino-4,6-dideoxygalactose transaminase